MTNDQLEAIYKANLPEGHFAGLAAVYTCGHNAGAGVASTASSPDQAHRIAAPAAIPILRRRG